MYNFLSTHGEKIGEKRDNYRGKMTSGQHEYWTTPGGWNFDLVYKAESTNDELVAMCGPLGETIILIIRKQ